jgi:hypothetical protein
VNFILFGSSLTQPQEDKNRKSVTWCLPSFNSGFLVFHNFRFFVIALLSMSLGVQNIESTFLKYSHLDLHALSGMFFGSHAMLEVCNF